MQRDIEDQKEEMKALQQKEKELHEQIKLLEKEVSAHKKEIKTRDVSIGEKEKRIYELKKKNQELDKFKFVLDFKIRELKQQIEPRQMEIMAMREKIKNMDEELEKYHKSNTHLDNLIGELRGKIDTMQSDVKMKRMRAKQLENIIAACRSEVQTAMTHIQSPPQLVAAVEHIVKEYGSLENVQPRVEPEVEAEYNRHRNFLQKSLQELKKALEASTMSHMATNNTIRLKNMALISEINKQREDNRELKLQVQADIGRIRHFVQGKGGKGKELLSRFLNKEMVSVEGGSATIAAGVGGDEGKGGDDFVDPLELLEKNRMRIRLLKETIGNLEKKNQLQSQKAVAKEILPPLEGMKALPQIAPERPLSSQPVMLPPVKPVDGFEMADSIEFGDTSPVSARGQKFKTYATEYNEQSHIE
ncbi:hypothetical protein EON65_14295 [archaeon]|nr:MAG: hypothetical protein EON65_14295 [archaeon]